MCTLTLVRQKKRLLITMNRDDLIERPEKPLATLNDSNTSSVYGPVDELSGGTWCGLNEHGVSAYLLNRYDHYTHNATQSRGLIIPQCLSLG